MIVHALAGEVVTARSRARAPHRVVRDPRIGSMLGDYFVVERIGGGGMATVYRALDRGGTSVAIKVPLPAVASDPELLERFVLEARALELARHPGVVGFVELAIGDDGVPFHVLEYVPGTTLAKLVRERPLRATRAGAIARELARILDALHGAGVIHRDVKPSNVIVRRDGTLALLDFGIAKILQLDDELTHAGFALGTPGYMAPEQSAGHACDPRVDVFAVGVLLRELASGAHPPIGHVTCRAAAAPPPRPAMLPRWCAAIVSRATARNRSARFSGAGELADALDLALAGATASMRAPRPANVALVLPPNEEPTLVDTPSAVPGPGFVVESLAPWIVRSPDGARLAVERVRPIDREHHARILHEVARLAGAGVGVVAPRVLAQADGTIDLAEPIIELTAARWLAEPRPPVKVAAVLAEIAAALAAAHDRGVIHRDLTLARISIVDGHARVGGFRIGGSSDDAGADVRALIAIAEALLPRERALAHQASAAALAAALRSLAR